MHATWVNMDYHTCRYANIYVPPFQILVLCVNIMITLKSIIPYKFDEKSAILFNYLFYFHGCIRV